MKFAKVGIRAGDLSCRMPPIYQLSHHHCPRLNDWLAAANQVTIMSAKLIGWIQSGRRATILWDWPLSVKSGLTLGVESNWNYSDYSVEADLNATEIHEKSDHVFRFRFRFRSKRAVFKFKLKEISSIDLKWSVASSRRNSRMPKSLMPGIGP